MKRVLEHGADIEFKDDRQTMPSDRVIIYDHWVEVINKHSYLQYHFPREDIESIGTHTTDEQENADWW